jgi:hypothetical protein
MKNKVYTEKEWLEIRGLLKWSVQLQGEMIDGKFVTKVTREDFIEEASNFLMEEEEALCLYSESLECTSIPTATIWYSKALVERYKGSEGSYSDTDLGRQSFILKRLQELGTIGYRRKEHRKVPIYILYSLLIILTLIGISQVLIFIKTESH